MKLKNTLIASALVLGASVAVAQTPPAAPAAPEAPAAQTPAFTPAQALETYGWYLGKTTGLAELGFSKEEIDAVIKDAPGVKATQTVGIPHDTLGEIVVTCIIPHEGATLDEEGIRAFAKQTLASYKVPRRVLFFAEGELEMTGSAKIKTKELRELAGKRLAE